MDNARSRAEEAAPLPATQRRVNSMIIPVSSLSPLSPRTPPGVLPRPLSGLLLLCRASWQRADTIAVPVFDNTTFSHGVEVELTEAIVKEVQRTTKWRVVDRQNGRHDSVQDHHRVRAQTALHLVGKPGLVMEQGVELSVDFQWQDGRSGEVLIARKGFKSLQSFVPTRGTGERLELGQHAAVQELARSIVNELRSNW